MSRQTDRYSHTCIIRKAAAITIRPFVHPTGHSGAQQAAPSEPEGDQGAAEGGVPAENGSVGTCHLSHRLSTGLMLYAIATMSHHTGGDGQQLTYHTRRKGGWEGAALDYTYLALAPDPTTYLLIKHAAIFKQRYFE